MEKKKIYDLEAEFLNAFEEATDTIIWKEREGNPMTLREVLTMGFNNVEFNGTMDYEPSSWTEKELDTRVEYMGWTTDAGGFRVVVLKTYTEEDRKW